VRLDFSENGDVEQTIGARRDEDGSFESQGRLFLPHGGHDIELRAFEENVSVARYLVDGPDAPLRYKFDGNLDERTTLLGAVPTPAPLDMITAPRVDLKRSPNPRPARHLEVTDTTEEKGMLRLVLE